MIEKELCPVCQRNIKNNDMTLHHYLPKSEGGDLNDTIRLCKTCHRMLHFLIPLKDVCLYDTPEKLQRHSEYKKYITWIRDKNHESMYPVKKVVKETQLCRK